MAIIQYVSFAGIPSSYGEVPIGVLGGANVFTIEVKLSTTDTKNRNNYYVWGTIAGREISGNWKDDWSLCVNAGKLCFWARPVNNGSTSTYRTYSEAVVNDGMIHEVAVRSNADGSIDLFCDGQNVAHQDGVNAKITDAETMLLAFNRNNNSELEYQLYEMRCWNIARADIEIFSAITGNENGLRAWYIPTSDNVLVDKSGNGFNAALFDTQYTEINSLPISLYCDVARRVKNVDKTWTYANVGTAESLLTSGTTLNNLPTTQSKTGSAFYQTTREKCFDIPATSEVWLKFDVYFDGTNRWRAYNGGSNGTTGISTQTDGGLSIFANDINVSPNGANIAGICKKNQLQTVLLHMISDVSEGIIEAWLDGTFVYRYSGNVNEGLDFSDVYLQSDGAGTFFSNIIISNSEVALDTNLEKVSVEFDVKRTVKKSVSVALDVSRRVLGTMALELFADVKRNVVRSLNFATDVSRKLYRTCEENFDVKIMEVVPVELTFDVARQICAAVNLFPTDTEEIFQGEAEIVARSVDNHVIIAQDLGNLQSLEVNISEQQLTDQVTFTSRQSFGILQYIAGQYFDYCYKLRIESITKQGLLCTCRCCSNIDKLLYEFTTPPAKVTETIEDDTKPQTADDDDEELDGLEKIKAEENKLLETGKYHTLNEYASIFADSDGLTAICRLNDYGDFYSSIADEDTAGRTRADNLREIFGWSARIPPKMINVYVRDDKYFFIQRGCEEHKIDITQTKHTEPEINHELVRTYWGSTPYSKTEIEEKILGTRGLGTSDNDNPDNPDDPSHDDDDDENEENPWSAAGSVTTADSAGTTTTVYTYTSSGVLTKAVTTFLSNVDEDENFTETITYSYNEYDLLSRTTTTITHPTAPEEDRRTEIVYGYVVAPDGKTFLAHETTVEYEANELGQFIPVDTTVITKSPTGRGQGGAVDSKGRGSAGGNIGDDRVTPYQLRSAFDVSRSRNIQTLKRKKTTTINGFTDVDPSFPLLQYVAREKVTADLKALNRTTKETVSVNVYNFAHIIDFNDKIILNGNEYFVSSNSVKTTSRIYNEQSLTLVRWF